MIQQVIPKFETQVEDISEIGGDRIVGGIDGAEVFLVRRPVLACLEPQTSKQPDGD
jgi:hypothetical protein